MYSAKYTNHYLGVGHKIPLHLQIFNRVSCTISMFAARRLLSNISIKWNLCRT